MEALGERFRRSTVENQILIPRDSFGPGPLPEWARDDRVPMENRDHAVFLRIMGMLRMDRSTWRYEDGWTHPHVR